MNVMKKLCTEEKGHKTVLQGNIAFATGCVRNGIHAVDGYPGTPSSEVIDKGLSQVQDMITVGWSVSESVALGVGHGHTLTGKDCVVTMKIPGLFQAGDVFTSLATFSVPRGGLVLYVATDFTPSSTQHVIDPHLLYKSSFVPVFEPRNHQELYESSQIAADLARKFNTAVVIQPSGVLCHSEGLVTLGDISTRELSEVAPMKQLNALPNIARINYDRVMDERMPALTQYIEESPYNIHHKGTGKRGVIAYGVNALYMEEYKELYDNDIDILSLGFTNPLPINKIKEFYASVDGDVFVLDDGYRYLQDECLAAGLQVIGKPAFSKVTEWTPASIAEFLGEHIPSTAIDVPPVPRPPMICAGCPYRLFAQVASKMKKSGKLEAIFGDIGCNTLLYFMDALDTGLAMGASESKRTGYVLSKPKAASKCISLIGDGTECHSGMDATRNAVFRNVAGVKVLLDNEWTAMTGGQPSPSSPVNLAGDKNRFVMTDALRAQGTDVVEVSAYDFKAIRKALRQALEDANSGKFTTLVIQGTCIRKVPKSAYGQKLTVDPEKCVACGACNICSGLSLNEKGQPEWNNLCSGCVSQTPACLQMCPKGAISVVDPDTIVAEEKAVALPPAPEKIDMPDSSTLDLPEKLLLSIRGVGGQGNLFFGKVLAQLAFLAGYGEQNIIKGETHGMAQMGGPVISTFACGKIKSPQIIPGTADTLIVMEKSEILRPGFLGMLKKGGTILLADTSILPQGLDPEKYPSEETLNSLLAPFNVITLDILDEALKLGDTSGRSANVVMLGALSMVPPFTTIPESLWLNAIKKVTPPKLWAGNYAAFSAGKNLL
ncbi:MAG: 2-oxoacid:acceptor oxidoreductase family protein [Desulfovibrionales bacterium]|nr:2-oxoacid:acceptor oxidoreductase family protein [Desulfovibrionales bacterium]